MELLSLVERIKRLLIYAEVEFGLKDDSGGLLFSTPGYKDDCFETVIKSGAESIRVAIVHGEGIPDAVAMLLKKFIEEDARRKKRYTFDDFFEDCIKGNFDHNSEKLKELRVKTGGRWLCINVEYDIEPAENIRDIFLRSLPSRVAAAEYKGKPNQTLILAEVSSGIAFEDMIDYARGLFQVLESEFSEKINIGISNCFVNLRDVRHSAQTAEKAAKYGKLMYGKDGVYVYQELGIAKAVANLSEKTRAVFMEELVRDSGVELLDNELRRTIHVYFQNNLNVSETARNLYIHRNTLAYRLDKIKKLTGLDLTYFDDAAYLRILLLLISENEGKDKEHIGQI
jgi:carbohydrate diacid regulator